MGYINTKNSYITVDNYSVAYRELGKGKSEIPLVMLVHLGATMDQWDPKTLDLISNSQHLIVVDLPGVGASGGKVDSSIPGMAKQALSIIYALGFKKVNLLGLSMGGMIAQEIVRLEGSLVNNLILVGTGPRAGLGIDKVTSTTFKHMVHAFFNRADIKRYIFYAPDKAGKKVAEEIFSRMNSRKEEYNDRKMKISSFLRQLKAIKGWSKQGNDDLKYITMPTLIVNGDDDRMVPTKNSYDMHKRIVNSKLIIYPNSGHGSIFQYPEKFSVDLLEFLDK